MKKKFLIVSLVLALFIITGCETKEKTNNNQPEQVENNVKQNNNVTTTKKVNDPKNEEKRVVVEKVINCEGCVYAYFSDDRAFGSTVTKDEYTTDINNLKNKAGEQRHNFFGFILSDSKIERAYSCILKDNKIYCIEGINGGAKYESNIGILNQIFTTDQCKYISDGNTYTCTDGHYNGRTKRNGDADLHYETSCRIVNLTKSTKISCV